MGEVKVWYMTEEERLEYIKKHPIRPTKPPKGISYVEVNDEMTKKGRKKHRWNFSGKHD